MVRDNYDIFHLFSFQYAGFHIAGVSAVRQLFNEVKGLAEMVLETIKPGSSRTPKDSGLHRPLKKSAKRDGVTSASTGIDAASCESPKAGTPAAATLSNPSAAAGAPAHALAGTTITAEFLTVYVISRVLTADQVLTMYLPACLSMRTCFV